MSVEQITAGRCYRVLLDGRLLVVRVLEIRGGPDGIVRWTLQGAPARDFRTDPLPKFASSVEAEVRC
jgi:hypothetical protein